ncbi:MAG: prephenate dehydratase [Acidimicrobiia bacterium]|nr:prephenate dehydratase [Acidimicrobiia bacterium]
MTRIAFLGPAGTFTEEALLSQPDLAEAELVPMPSFPDVLRATADGDVDYGFVALENSIEGTVRLVMDLLVFEHELLIQREVVLPIRQNLLAPPGLALSDVRRVVSFPDALAQCRDFFERELPGAEIVAANSTAEAVQLVASERPSGTAALGTALAAKLYGLEVIAADVEDSAENMTRFVLVAREAIPPITGHDKTSIVCFQQADRPGSLHGILGQFTARNINLTRLASRPTKKALGEYCFIIDLEGHVDDEIVADCLRDLHAQLKNVKFLGSYPAASEHGPAVRRDAEAKWKAADDWIASLRQQVRR